jgi:hypothetical protein
MPHIFTQLREPLQRAILRGRSRHNKTDAVPHKRRLARDHASLSSWVSFFALCKRKNETQKKIKYRYEDHIWATA